MEGLFDATGGLTHRSTEFARLHSSHVRPILDECECTVIVAWTDVCKNALLLLNEFIPVVGNSPLHLNESSTGLGNVIIILMPSRYCSENLPTFQTT